MPSIDEYELGNPIPHKESDEIVKLNEKLASSYFERLLLLHKLAKITNELVALQAENKQLQEAVQILRKIVSLDDDAHPGLMTWHTMRSAVHSQAQKIIKGIPCT